MTDRTYSVSGIVTGLNRTLIEYLEAQYHIWNESVLVERRRLLEAPGVSAQLPFLEATPAYRYADGYESLQIPQRVKEVLARCAELSGTGVYPRPFVHQARALEAILVHGHQLVVGTGTGSGKTESFLLPILGSLALEGHEKMQSRDLPGCRAILLYPMNALVNDQLARLRRLFGNIDIAKAVASRRHAPFRFAMYTSRTPYPGQRDPGRDRRDLKPLLESLFSGLSQEDVAALKAEGKWPAKDIDAFIRSGFQTSAEDRELFTRQEVQATCPEILVTNYSMLEYMLLRPIEADIFEQTSNWLAADDGNVLTVVIDEAHMYRGAQGAEVALLLRRLQSRLDVPRTRLRYILTSASFGTSAESQAAMHQFAVNLTGAGGAPFVIVESKIDQPKDPAPAAAKEADGLEHFQLHTIQGVLEGNRLNVAIAQIQELSRALGAPSPTADASELDLREAAYAICERLPVAALLAKTISGQARPFLEVATELFPARAKPSECLEALLALVTFAKRRRDDRPFLPVRLHLLFRGLPGVFACASRTCSARRASDRDGLLGRLYDAPRLRCACGSRVYEILTHRDCGATFIRGYVRDLRTEFMWHEPPAHRDPALPALVEAHFLVEGDRDRSIGSAQLWLHTKTGRLVPHRPADESGFLPVKRPPGFLRGQTPQVISFDGECPVCLREWRGTSRIMDLETKGEQPFAHLIKTQVQLQPASKPPSARFPNAGRKSLLFSDGRQKAARLARDIPREIEHDTFRQLLMLAVRNLRELNRDAVPTGTILYLAFVDAVTSQNVELFDGRDAETLDRHVASYREYCGGQLSTALNENLELPPPPRYKEGLLRQLGAPFYSLFALTLAYVVPKPFVARRLAGRLTRLSKEEIESITVIWVQNFLDRFAFDPDITASTRNSAAGWRQKWGETTGYRRDQRRLANSIFQNTDEIQSALFDELTVDRQGGRFLEPNKLQIVSAFDRPWFQCAACTFLAPSTWRGACANCGSSSVVTLNFDDSVYLRARKTFWRDPVTRLLGGTEKAFSLDVEEHTAQLNYRDTEKPNPTTETFERRFRDILVGTADRPIDVLSCTTTMEVGVDIGSLVAVGLRNVPPQRQNYQQRAGRAGRRGASVSTVVTYAQNNPHDSHYFENPTAMISGSPPDPSVDSDNPTIVSRHANAQLIQTFFHAQEQAHRQGGDITTVLGPTLEFFHGTGDFTVKAFADWLESDLSARCMEKLESWLPPVHQGHARTLAKDLVLELSRIAPEKDARLVSPQSQLLEFLFSNGVLPSYAFPRHLLALQIERREGGFVRTLERPQQGLSVALSEYAPGRWVVVNKETYKIGTVAANSPATEMDRAVSLFAKARRFVQCPNCFHTELDRDLAGGEQCAICRNAPIARIEIIQPEVVFPQGAGAIDELGDEQVFTEVTSAQLPYPRGGQSLNFTQIGSKTRVAHGHNEELVLVNRGEASAQGGTGFLVCEQCGKSQLPSVSVLGRHDRDYLIQDPANRRQPPQCDGQFRPVYLGYMFATDILVMRVTLDPPLNARYDDSFHRRPLVDAVRSLSEALALAAANSLDVDPRELKAGFRFLTIKDERVADVFLYDTLAGGAGYASMAGKKIDGILRETKALLQNCSCTSSCDKCLRSYENRFFHRALNRLLGLEMLRYAESGAVPSMLSAAEQRLQLEPLAEFLRLEGWSVADSEGAAYSITHGGTNHLIGCYPGLRDFDAVQGGPNLLLFSEYEIANALPDAAARVTP